MAQHARCCLPSFNATPGGPKRPVSLKVKTTPAQRAKLLSAFEQNSLDPLLKSAWGLLLHRYTGIEDICFGYERCGVDEPLNSHLLGTKGLLTCRLRIDGNDSIETILKKSAGKDCFENGVKLKEDRGTDHDDYSLFNTIVMLRVYRNRMKDGTSVRPVLPTTLPKQCRARLHVKVLRGDFCIFIEWWNTEISATHMESITCYFEQLLDQAIFNQSIAVADTAYFLEHDWSRICKFNSTLPQTHDRCIHEVIQEQAQRHPQREAVCAWDGNLTFEELDHLSSKLAYHLQRHGVVPETRVALCFEKSKWNIVAMLGVLKAGGAFVPLDPDHPKSRLRSLVESVDGRIMLCSRDRAESLSMVAEHLIPLDEQLLDGFSLPPGGDTHLGGARSHNAAYLIFTSGSTGNPKGALLEHRAFVSCAAVFAPQMNMDSNCRSLQFAAHTFDASLAESLAPLMHGGCVCVPSDGDRLNDVIRVINELRANTVIFTPSFVRFINPSNIPGVKTLILAGEAMSMADVETWSHINLINGYGPTESAPTSVRFWVVNQHDHNRLVPVGSPGELLLEGPSLARCYWNNPQKTDEAFILNPTWAIRDVGCGNRRFYKTGDLVMYNSDAGSLTFLGRKDTQINLHGQRVKLEEIEINISTLPKSGCVEAMPLLSSGKLNRKEIVSWASHQTDKVKVQTSICGNEEPAHASYPDDTIEDRLVYIWSRVLNIPRQQLDREESFLSLGGDSIAAIACMGYFKKHGMSLTVQDVLQCKSVRDLATRAEQVDQPVAYHEATEVSFDPSPIQKLHFMTRSEGQGYFNQSVCTRLNQPVREHDLRCAIETIIKRHSMLRTRLVKNPALDPLQLRITEEVDSSYRLRVHNIGQQLDMESAVWDSQACIDAFEGPLLSVDLFQANIGGYFLSMVAHHLVVDIVSWRIILEDLEDILMNPEVKASNAGSIPFSTWCRLQDERTQALNSILNDPPAVNSAYWGMENQVATYGDATCETFELDPEDSHLILSRCHKALETEPVDVLLASLLYAFGQTFGDRQLPVIHNEGHGREVWDSMIDISRTVGWFTTLFPISIACQAADDPVETVIHVKDLRRSVSDNGRQGFADRMSATKYRGKQKDPAPMEISFNYVGQHRDLQRQDGLFRLMNQMAGEAGQGGGSSDYGKTTPRFALFEISALSVNGRLQFTFFFSKHMRHQEAIRTWIANCSDVLRFLGKRLQSISPKPTLSSYPMLSLTYQELEDMISTKLPEIGVNSPDLIEDIYPCSRLQEGILLAQSRDSFLYAVHDTYEVSMLEDKPNAMRLAKAWRMVVCRHAMLRTLFVDNLTRQDLFSQVVLKSFDPPIIHLTCLEDKNVLSTFNSQHPATHGKHYPHHRLTTCETATGRLFFRLEFSHAAMDGVSISEILRDLQVAYDGKLDPHRPLFKKYIHHLRNISQEPSLEYWRTYLAGLEPCLFPILNDGQEVPQKAFRTMQLSFSLFNELQALCENGRLTISTAFTAAWGLTLRHFCNTNDVCFSYMASLRDSLFDDIESVVGPVINLLACRMRISEKDRLKDILQTVQNDCIQQLSHNSLYLVDIQHELNLSDTALLNSGISYQKSAKLATNTTAGIQFSRVGTVHDPAEYPLFVNVVASDKNADIELNYWTNMLSDGQAQNVASIFLKNLHDIVRHHDDQIGLLECLSERNKQNIRKWNKEVFEEPEVCVDSLVRGKTGTHPDAQAIRAWDGNFTYSDLDRLSSSLATYLAQFGVSTGTLVSVNIDRSRWQIVAILAILKARGVCVPGGENHATNSLDNWSAVNGMQIALTTPSSAASLEETYPVVITIDESLFEALPDQSAAIYQQPKPMDDGYVILTTDNTYHTSAVVLSQRAIMARAAAFASALDLDSKTKTFQFAPPSSDMFLQELFGTMVNGGCLFIVQQKSTVELSEMINLTSANFISIPPTIASNLRPSEVPEIQTLALYGELPTRAIKEAWSKKVQLHSFFGTAECSSTCLHKFGFDTQDTLPTIGSSTGCRSWLVDPSDYSRLVPVGCVGELLIEGPGISHGYLYDEIQTKDRFIELGSKDISPTGRTYSLSSEYSHQMFRTGQSARYNSDGTLVYLGRKDKTIDNKKQVLALQIEQLLEDSNLLDNRCVVEALDFQSEEFPETYTTIFVMPKPGPSFPAEGRTNIIAPKTSGFHQVMAGIHSYLSTSLPPTQVPSLYFPVQVLPLTFLGTVNRQLLRDSIRALPASSLLGYDLKRFGDFWRHELGGVAPSGSGLLLPLSALAQPALKTLENSVMIPWGGFLQRRQPKPSLFAAWALTVHRYTKCEDMIVGDLTAQSTSIFPRRVRLNSLDSIAQLLVQISSSLAAAEDFQRAPLSSIRSLNPDTARACSFETMLSISEIGVEQQMTILKHLETEENTNSELGVCPLVVFCTLEQEGLLVAVRYDERVLFSSQIARLTTLFGESLELLKLAARLQEQVSNLKKRGGENLGALHDTLNYWRDQLAEIEPCLFPALSPKGEQSTFSVESLRLSNASKIYSACKPLSITPNSLLQVVWGLVLRCYTGLEDVCFGYHVSPKKTPTGILPCRLSLHDNLKLKDTILSRREDMDRALKHRMSFLEIRRAIGMEGTPIFNTAFRYRRSSAGATEFSNALLNSDDDGLNQYLIVVTASAFGSSGEINFEYQPSCLSRSDIDNIIDCFEHTLSSVLATLGSDSHIQNIEFFGPLSCQKVSKWNASLPAEPKRCAPEVIQNQVYAHPSRSAICSWDGNFTYAQLDSLSTKLACHLVDRGVGPEVFVGLCFEKSAWAVIAQVAVLKAGGVFTSLDPAHPESRLRCLIDDIGARVVLCSTRYLEKVSQIYSATLAVDQGMLKQLPDVSADWNFPSLNIRNAAYAIFTSGTTGKPKVTVLEHVALGIAALSFKEVYGMGPNTRAIQFSSYTFDVSIFETIIVLMTGGCVCIPSDDERMNDLGRAIRRMEANMIACTPSVTDTLDPASVPSLRTIINGGEKRTEAQIARWADRNYFNAYGPSEATVIATSSRKVDLNGARLDDDSNSIGTAICGRAWIVDPHNYNRLLPVGAAGELVLEGQNIARGYLNNEKKTNEVFVNQPQWCGTAGLRDVFRYTERMYRTGDLVRYKSDGNLCFISRIGTQVKLNGQRVELEEIEQQCISLSPAGTQVVVDIVVPETKTMAKCLAAFITVKESEARGNTSRNEASSSILLPVSDAIRTSLRALHASLSRVLPQVMIPKLYFPLRYLPLGSTGKLDRRGLRSMVECFPKAQLKQYMILTSGSGGTDKQAAESALRNLWGEVLQLDPGSIRDDDSFFALGGDSFFAMKLVGSANSQDISLTITDIYAHPVLSDLTHCCRNIRVNIEKSSLEPFALIPNSVPRQDILEEASSQSDVAKEIVTDADPCAVGELALEGPPLAREYLKNPKKTAEAFINEPVRVKASPSSLSSPRRFYKTGDLVRYNIDGTVEYLDPKDHQVKVQGQRKELGEIEHCLLDCQNVRPDLVVLPQAGPLKQKPVGVLSLKSLASESGLNSGGALEQLTDRRSIEEMIDKRIKLIISQMLKDGKLSTPWSKEHDTNLPKDFFHIEEGIEDSSKGIVVARQKTPSDSTLTLASDYRAPNDVEKQLWRLWGITLGLPLHPVKYHDNFFKLGGDSVTAMKLNPIFEDMVAFISKQTKPEVPNLKPKHGETEKYAEDTPILLRSESSQEISTLKPIELDDTSVRAAICSKIGGFKGGIVDILPVTDFQSLSITATMFESRWMLNYFYLDGKGSLDIRRLRESFLHVVDAFDILRTVFVCYQGQFFQVVLRKIWPDIFVHETDKSLAEYTQSLQQRDRTQPPGQGEQNVQFYVVRKKNSDAHRTLVRISHAQFDGVSLPKIMTAIKMAYEGCPIMPSFYLNYLRVLHATISLEHYQHWTTLLKGSRMTEVIRRDRPNAFQDVGSFAEQKKTIKIPSTATENITIATVMQSAWAISLAKLSAQDDVVFGITVNGRNAVPGLENTIGPCLNFIPIRVRFRDRWTALDLFRYLQDLQVSNMPYESLGFREIIRRCTDWPESTFFTTTVLHQNVDYEGQMQLDHNTYRMGGVGVIDNFTDLALFSKPLVGQPNQITVSLGYSLKGPLYPTFVSTVLDMVCDTAQSLVANPNVILPFPSTLRSLPLQLVEDASTTASSDNLLSSLNNRSLSEILAHSELLTRVWHQVLPPRSTTGKSQPSYQLDSSFFSLGGDIVNMAQLVWILEQETNLHVRLEDLLAHPTFLGQMAVVALYTSKRDVRANGSSKAAPAYDADPTVNAAAPAPAKSENWSALDRARILAKKLTRFGGSSTRL
ncbi:hypothetical protein BJX63DRAFT_429511 [Aspergillus granulosus]|uniref:Carrier domain-containing protein n=1 Tax=Aspergillus granulosus TaxID=176169 RepID=A0ABR4HQQ6_9EURO